MGGGGVGRKPNDIVICRSNVCVTEKGTHRATTPWKHHPLAAPPVGGGAPSSSLTTTHHQPGPQNLTAILTDAKRKASSKAQNFLFVFLPFARSSLLPRRQIARKGPFQHKGSTRECTLGLLYYVLDSLRRSTGYRTATGVPSRQHETQRPKRNEIGAQRGAQKMERKLLN